MNLQEIIDELPKLTPEERDQVRESLRKLHLARFPEPKTALGRALLEIAGTVDGPPDWAENHDHYIHGTPKRSEEDLR